jgi:lipopolysaccharide export system protein LptA
VTPPLLLLLALAAPPAPAPTPAAPRPPASAPASPAAAATATPVPAKVQADVIRYNWTTRKVKMEGKPFVTITREDMVLTCRHLVGDNDVYGQMARATCEGDVKLVRGTRVVTCERAQYDRDAARVICEGNPVLRDGETEARGKKLTYLLVADEVLLEEAVQATVPGEKVEQVSRKPAPPPAPASKPTSKPAPKPAGGGT